MTTAAMATMATVETATITRTFSPCAVPGNLRGSCFLVRFDGDEGLGLGHRHVGVTFRPRQLKFIHCYILHMEGRVKPTRESALLARWRVPARPARGSPGR
jgi:hypothetical protein